MSLAEGTGAVEWKLLAFEALSLHELHELLQLRNEVFVVEQNCVFQDIDGADPQAAHLLGQGDGQLLAYARCFPRGLKFAEASIGRVLVRTGARGQNLGHLLIEQAVSAVNRLWGPQAIRIGAQFHLEKYYNNHGFVTVGEPYVEDGIPHLAMIWQP
jgi:ElaA protein